MTARPMPRRRVVSLVVAAFIVADTVWGGGPTACDPKRSPAVTR
jgi:hypothetical protein